MDRGGTHVKITYRTRLLLVRTRTDPQYNPNEQKQQHVRTLRTLASRQNLCVLTKMQHSRPNEICAILIDGAAQRLKCCSRLIIDPSIIYVQELGVTEKDIRQR